MTDEDPDVPGQRMLPPPTNEFEKTVSIDTTRLNDFLYKVSLYCPLLIRPRMIPGWT